MKGVMKFSERDFRL